MTGGKAPSPQIREIFRLNRGAIPPDSWGSAEGIGLINQFGLELQGSFAQIRSLLQLFDDPSRASRKLGLDIQPTIGAHEIKVAKAEEKDECMVSKTGRSKF